MKNNVKVNEFSYSVTTLDDGTQRIHYDAYDFAGIRGFGRREWRRLFLTKKKFPVTRIFRYSEEWDTMTDGGCISYWDQTSQAQIPLYALRNETAYQIVTTKQRQANDVLYYCLQADDLITQLTTVLSDVTFWDVVLPTVIVGGIILTAVMNVYSVNQYLQAWGLIKGTMGTLGSLQHLLSNFAGVS